ncbi:MAG: FUSC family protein [Polyangiaceae bacterium]
MGRVPFRLTSHARDALRLTPGRPAIALGVRAAIATMVPILAGMFFAAPDARWASIAGFSAVVVDKGGAYRTRATAMAAVTFGSTMAVLISGLTGSWWSAALFMLVFASAGGLLRVLGPEMASVGTSSAVMLALAVDARLSLSNAIDHVPYIVIGGGWAMVVSLLFWPIRVHRPGRIAVARVFDDLAEHGWQMARALTAGNDEAWRAMLQRDHNQLRNSIETARAVLAATRRGNRGESGRGARLLVLFSMADQIFVALVAFADAVDDERRENHSAVATRLNAVAVRLAALAVDIRNEEKVDPTKKLSDQKPDLTNRIDVIFARMSRLLDLAHDVVATIHDDAPLPASDSAFAEAAQSFVHRDSPFEGLRAAFSADSAIARHAARLGISAAVAVLTTRALGLQRGYWVTLTVIIVLQPYTPETLRKGMQRIAGTLAGGILAAAVVYFVRDEAVIFVLASILAAASVAVLQLNYALYAFFLTPTFVLLAEVSAGDFHLAKLRILDTVIGGAIAFLGARILWPSSEHRRFPTEMAAALRAGRELLDASVERYVIPARFDSARRKFGIAINNADASFQRLLAEAGVAPVAMEPRMTLLLFARRLAGSCIRAATLGASEKGEPFVRSSDDLLENLADCVARGIAPKPLPPPDPLAPGDPNLERIALQLRVLHDAALRLSSDLSAEVAPSTSG